MVFNDSAKKNERQAVMKSINLFILDTMLGRMFSLRAQHQDKADLVRPNEQNEFEVADGISASCFRAILVCFAFDFCQILFSLASV